MSSVRGGRILADQSVEPIPANILIETHATALALAERLTSFVSAPCPSGVMTTFDQPLCIAKRGRAIVVRRRRPTTGCEPDAASWSDPAQRRPE